MLIEVYSDTVCPWCFVGFARLQQALARRPDLDVQVVWLPFELNPEMPRDGEDRAAWMQRRFGDVNKFAAAQGSLRDMGSELGIQFDFARIQRMPNTRRSHALIAFAAGVGAGLQTEVKRRILAAYFSEGRDIGDPATLREIAAEAGLDPAGAAAALDDAAVHDRIVALERQAHDWGISGVPTFIFDRRLAFSGGQPVDVFLQAFDEAARLASTEAAGVATNA